MPIDDCFVVLNSLGKPCLTLRDGSMQIAVFTEKAPADMYAEEMRKRNIAAGSKNASPTDYNAVPASLVFGVTPVS